MTSIQNYIDKLAEAYTDKSVLENSQSLLDQHDNVANNTFKTTKSDQQKNSAVYSHINSMKDTVRIYIELSCQLGNHCLQIYKGFKFASMLDIPFDNVFVVGQYNPLFKSIKQHFIQSIPDDLSFDFELTSIDMDGMIKTSNTIKQYLIDGKSNINVKFRNWNWIYPSSIEDFCLFNFLFDGNDELIDRCLSENKSIFGQNMDYALVGFTIRRGEFIKLNWKVLLADEILNILNDLKSNYLDMVKIVITSDEISNVENDIYDKKCCYFIKNRTPVEQIVILSFCDYVISNGAYYRCKDTQVKGYDSTFGQIAQILNVSRKFSLRTLYTHEYFIQNRYLNYKEQEYKQIVFDQLMENSYMIHCMLDRDRLELEQILFRYHGLQFPHIFEAKTDNGICVSPCMNSYYYLLKMAIEKDLPYILVFEDDAYPCNNIVDYLKDYIKYVPNDAEMLQLGWTMYGGQRDDKISSTGDSPGTQASIIFKNGYKKILNLLHDKQWIDRLGTKLNHSYIVDVPLFIQYNFNAATFGNRGYDISHFNEHDRLFFRQNYTPIVDILNTQSNSNILVKKFIVNC